MKVTKVIDGAGKFVLISISEDDQTVGLTILGGPYSGVLQAVGLADQEGQENNLPVYNPDGTAGNLEDPLPLTLFLDCAGYTEIKIQAVTWTSGSITVHARVSTGQRIRPQINEGGVGPQVQVSNFPGIQPVSGPLTNTQLRQFPVDVSMDGPPPGAALDSSLQTLLGMSQDYDSDGNLLPIAYYSTPPVYTYDSNNVLQTAVRTVGAFIYTKTYSFDSNGNFLTVSRPVKTNA